jgi:hypothetical protein
MARFACLWTAVTCCTGGLVLFRNTGCDEHGQMKGICSYPNYSWLFVREERLCHVVTAMLDEVASVAVAPDMLSE